MMNKDTWAEHDVSRETREMLEIYLALLRKWSSSINLVSKATLDDAWDRHILDSAQIRMLMPPNVSSYADFGSGAGFPGLVLAILMRDTPPVTTLVESDQRKCAFLRTVARDLNLSVTIEAQRIEALQPLRTQTLTARALAPLTQLLGFAESHLSDEGRAWFPKGATWREELSAAHDRWAFTCEVHPSKTDSNAVILEIGEISHV